MPVPQFDKLFNSTFQALPAADQTTVEQLALAGKLTMREAVANGSADIASVDEWVEFWHEGHVPLELREFLGLDTSQYALWMREPSSLSASFAIPAAAPELPRVFSDTEYVPMQFWGKDHWSTLAYIETVMVECAGFQVGTDARMKTGRRNSRVMANKCRQPKRPGKQSSAHCLVMTAEQSTKLNNGQLVTGHDDWSCVQDMAAECLFVQAAHDVEPGVVLQFSVLGHEIANALREFKRNKGQYSQFRWPVPAVDVSPIAA